MAEIRAFVGHSFAEQDIEVVRKFTDYFDTLQNGALDFEWVHATQARPENVSAKVLELIDGKNLFIGICTRNERVAKDSRFKSFLFSQRFLIQRGELEWKTSDWIIQESGLAIGLGMNLILLVEEGVRQPGGLQGNLEYIPFNRGAPEKAFARIFEMICAIMPQIATASDRRGGEPIAPATVEERDKNRGEILKDPEDSWEYRDYQHQFLAGLAHKDEAHAQKIYEAFLNSEAGRDKDENGKWKAFCELFKLKWAKNGSLDVLKSIAEQHKTNSVVQMRMAQGYLHYEDFQRAKEYFRVSLDVSDDNMQKIERLGDLANIANRQESGEDLMAIVGEMRLLVNNSEMESRILSNLSGLSGWYRDDIMKIALMERELALDPADTKKRFQLAYLHSGRDNQKLAMYHYEKIPANERDGATWNNLGATYQGFSWPGKSVTAYRNAADQSETLAMSNLAYSFMRSGFLKEAQDVINEAQKIPDFHNNVASALIELTELPKEEAKSHDKAINGAVAVSNFMSHAGEIAWQGEIKKIPSILIDAKCRLSVSVSGGDFFAKGEYFEASKNSLGTALGIKPRSGDMIEVTVEYRGRFVGGVVVGKKTVRRKRGEGAEIALLGAVPDVCNIIIVVPDGAVQVRALIGEELSELTLEYDN